MKKQYLINKANLIICWSVLALFGLCSKMYAAPFAYIPNSGSNNVSIIDTANNRVVTTVFAGTTPYGVATVVTSTETFALIANVGSNNVSVIRTFKDLTNNTVVFQKLLDVPVGRGPHGIAADPAGTFAYVTNSTDGTVSKIDLSNFTVAAATITVGSNPLGIVVTPNGASIYVANNSSGTVSVISTANNTNIVTVPVGANPVGIAVNPAGTFIYVANSGDNSVSVIKTADNSVITHSDIHFATPTGVTVNPAGTLAYITNTGSASVSLFDTANNIISSPNIIVGVNPFGISLNTLGTFTYVVNSSGTVSVIDNSTNSEKLPRITVGSAPRALGPFIAPFGTVPTVTSTIPVNAATDVSLGTTIQATFSDDVNASTINSLTFLVSGGITGTVTYNSATRTATFTPSSLHALIKNTTYTATLTTGITNLAGTALSTNVSWSFTTSAGEDNGNCFIATAVYGSYNDVHVQILRRFRDEHLLPHAWGATLVDIYYRYSPSIADFIRGHNFLRKPALWALTPVVYFVQYPSHLAWIIGLGLIIIIGARRQRLRLRKLFE